MMSSCLNGISIPEPPTPADYAASLTALAPSLYAMASDPAEGTWERLRFLMQCAEVDLGLARLVEGHMDALGILSEAGLPIDPNDIYGVWASGGRSSTLRVEGQTLDGCKPFCSGAGIVSRALIHIHPDDVLLDVPLDDPGISLDSSAWQVAAFRATSTANVRFEKCDTSRSRHVGPRGWYFGRRGFWIGALGPAACWAGGALALVGQAVQMAKDDSLARVQLGAMEAAAFGMQAGLKHAAELASAHVADNDALYLRALSVRHLVERAATEIVDRFQRLFGPRPLVYESGIARRISELNIYIRQCHAERDLEALGRLVAERSARIERADCVGEA